MCTTCGCSAGEVAYSDPASGVQIVIPSTSHALAAHDLHDHPHDHPHHHDDDHSHPHDHHTQIRTIILERDILAKNQLAAERNRGWFAGREVLAINLMSSPGAGKTTLLEHTIRDLGSSVPICVIEGDQATANDGARIRAAGAPVIQINTGTGCHLDADMVWHGVRHLAPTRGSLVMIENVGNLVCPALFDLGEQTRAVILSVTEGEDKPLKYPQMFRTCQLMVITKTDLLPYVRFDMNRCIAAAREVNPGISVLQLSAETGTGLDIWYDWLRTQATPRPTA